MRSRVLVLAVTAALALPTVAAKPSSSPISLEDVKVKVAAGSVQVTGKSVFDVEVLAFEDAAGDAPFPGADLGSGTIRQSDEGEIAFSLTLGTVPAQFPPTIAYVWPLDDGGTQLVAWPNSTRSGSPAWTFSVVFADGANSSESQVAGEYAGGVITWFVNPAVIGAKAGAVIGADEYGDPVMLDTVATSLSADSATWVISGYDLDTADNDTLFAVGGGARLVLRTKDGRYLDETLTRTKRGVFTGGFDGLAKGTYRLEIIAEAGQDSISKTKVITIP